MMNRNDGFIATIIRIFRNTTVLSASFILLIALSEVCMVSKTSDKYVSIFLILIISVFLTVYLKREFSSHKARVNSRF